MHAATQWDLTKDQWVYYHSTITLKTLNGSRASPTHTHTHTHPFNAVSLWCANSHAYYITGLLLPGPRRPWQIHARSATHELFINCTQDGAGQKYRSSQLFIEKHSQTELGVGSGCTGIDQSSSREIMSISDAAAAAAAAAAAVFVLSGGGSEGGGGGCKFALSCVVLVFIGVCAYTSAPLHPSCSFTGG